MKIALFLDGTWSDQDSGTNIAQIHARTKNLHDKQVSEYGTGVGTSIGERYRGGAFAHGLDKKIIEGYEIIVEKYNQDDEIFLFGYSRGAFTARSLAGMIAKCGIIRHATLSRDRVFARYRNKEAPGLLELRSGEQRPRRGKDGEEDERVEQESTLARIRFIGVFDTVGSLGIPGTIGRLFSGRYAFHDTRLSGLVDHARHAIALDERRASFEPTLWTSVPIPVPGPEPSTVEQRWFIGSHGNIGGGRPPPGGENRLSTITREWMIGEAVAKGLAIEPAAVPGDAHLGRIDPTHRNRFFAAISAIVPSQKGIVRPVRKTNLNETLDNSVLNRWAEDPEYRNRSRPPNPGLRPWIQEQRAGQGLPPLPDD
jgi:uncharacterized protein (DUF2235 family)